MMEEIANQQENINAMRKESDDLIAYLLKLEATLQGKKVPEVTCDDAECNG
jgi:hypothetical protein